MCSTLRFSIRLVEISLGPQKFLRLLLLTFFTVRTATVFWIGWSFFYYFRLKIFPRLAFSPASLSMERKKAFTCMMSKRFSENQCFDRKLPLLLGFLACSTWPLVFPVLITCRMLRGVAVSSGLRATNQ